MVKMPKRWQATGWQLADGKIIGFSLFLPGRIGGYVEHRDRDCAPGWYWWNGSDRDHRPPTWPGNGPLADPAEAALCCEEKLRSEIAMALVILSGRRSPTKKRPRSADVVQLFGAKP